MQTAVIRIAAFACLLGFVMPLPGTDQFLDPECGLQTTSSPWMAILYDDFDDFVCAGTLITNRLVLTTASCLGKSHNLMVRLGEYWRFRKSQYFGLSHLWEEGRGVDWAFRNRNYDPKTHANDIAIMRLREPVVYNVNIRPICIPRNTALMETINAIQELTGIRCGKTEEEEPDRTLELRRQPPGICADFGNVTLDSNQFFAGNMECSKCNGDEGSPVGAMIRTTEGQRFVQIGIYSLTKQKCQKAAVFTDVLGQLDFILRVWRGYGSS